LKQKKLKMPEEKLPPYDIEAEKAVLGSLLIDGESIFEIATFLNREDFFAEENKYIYDACLNLFERHEGINQVTVARELTQKGKLEMVGGSAYLSHLIFEVPTTLHIEYYGQIVSRLAVMRKLISASHRIATIGYEADANLDEALNKAEDIILKIRQQRVRGNFIPLKDILNRYFEEIGPMPSDSLGPHVLTGFNVLDNLLIGLQRSALIVLAARPGIGKTTLALNIARNAAINQKACVAIFSVEMSQNEIVQRFLSSEADVPSLHVRLGRYTEEEEKRIMEASGILSEAPIYIDDSPQLRALDIRSKARRLHFERKIDLVIIDYLQLLKGDTRIENRVQELSEITRSLKALARELNVPVLAVSQLSRAIEMRITHKPQLSDLRDSGSIEQDADVVLFIHREEKYISEEDWAKKSTEAYPRGIADLIIAKNRNGPVDDVKLQFVAKTTKFKNLETMPSATFRGK
jgi:replicative DNA helicase